MCTVDCYLPGQYASECSGLLLVPFPVCIAHPAFHAITTLHKGPVSMTAPWQTAWQRSRLDTRGDIMHAVPVRYPRAMQPGPFMMGSTVGVMLQVRWMGRVNRSCGLPWGQSPRGRHAECITDIHTPNLFNIISSVMYQD